MKTSLVRSKSADDTKITSRVTTTADKLKVQSNFDISVSWSKKCQMKFNADICKVLHIANNDHYTKCTMKDSKLSKVNHEKDFWITISNDLKPSKHCLDVVEKANKLVGFIERTFEYKSEKIIPTLFNALFTPSSRILHSFLISAL